MWLIFDSPFFLRWFGGQALVGFWCAPRTPGVRRLVLRVPGRAGVTAETVLVPDLAVAAVDHQLAVVAPGDRPAGIFRCSLSAMRGRWRAAPLLLDPPAVAAPDDV